MMRPSDKAFDGIAVATATRSQSHTGRLAKLFLKKRKKLRE
jgi:hypothetical protein